MSLWSTRNTSHVPRRWIFSFSPPFFFFFRREFEKEGALTFCDQFELADPRGNWPRQAYDNLTEIFQRTRPQEMFDMSSYPWVIWAVDTRRAQRRKWGWLVKWIHPRVCKTPIFYWDYDWLQPQVPPSKFISIDKEPLLLHWTGYSWTPSPSPPNALRRKVYLNETGTTRYLRNYIFNGIPRVIQAVDPRHVRRLWWRWLV